MSQEGRGCLVGDQGGSDKVAQFKVEGRGPDPPFPHWIRACNHSHRVWKQNGILTPRITYALNALRINIFMEIFHLRVA